MEVRDESEWWFQGVQAALLGAARRLTGRREYQDFSIVEDVRRANKSVSQKNDVQHAALSPLVSCGVWRLRLVYGRSSRV